MEKVICDICATAYPATANECPICGYPRQSDAKIVHHTDEVPVETGEKPRVKGGRFSNKNVKKRQKEALEVPRIKAVPVPAEEPEDIPEITDEPKAEPKAVETAETPVVPEIAETPVIPAAPEVAEVPETPEIPETPETPETPEEPVETVEDADDAEDTEEAADEPEEEDNPNKILLIIIALLLAAIVCVTAYIAIRFFLHGNPEQPEETTTAPTTTAPAQTTLPTGEQKIACAALYLDASKLKLDTIGKEYRLKVTTIPADTTEEVTFVSSDTSVATVSDDGVITAVGSGQAEIIITCGQVEVVCDVTCTIEEPTTAPTTQPTTPPTTAPTEPPVETTAPPQPVSKELTLSHTDVTLFQEGETFRISVKEGDSVISRIKVEWSSSDETVATVENGTVTAVAPGVATITASYNGKEATCLVRCRFETEEEPEETEPTETKPEETTKPTEPADQNWAISHTDVTLTIGEKFTLRIRNGAGQTAEVTWSMSNPETVTVNGNTVEAIAAGTVILTATVDGVEYQCIVRVKAPA